MRIVAMLLTVGALGVLLWPGGACAGAAGEAGSEAPQQPAASAAGEDAVGEDAEGASEAKARPRSKRKSSGYTSWKRRLPFWQRKAFLLTELSVFITAGVLIAQMLEVAGWVKFFAVLMWPVIKLGRLGDAASAALLMAVQSGAVANSMLVSSRDRGQLSNRQLYTAVLVVSCLSLFAHLPTYVIPIGAVIGAEATFWLFAVRFMAIFVEIIVILLVSNLIVSRWTDDHLGPVQGTATPELGEETQDAAEGPSHRRERKKRGFWPTVWSRSSRTIRRLLIYLVPTYSIMAVLEYYGAFKALAGAAPGLCSFSFLPPQSAVIIPAQVMSLYNGAIAAAAYIDSGAITPKQAVLVIITGSLVTAPVRTMKHAMPTYVAVLGPKAGPVMAFSAQVLRSIFLIGSAIVMWILWT